MNAKELAAIYRPLWQLAPETIPLWLHCDNGAELCWAIEGEMGDIGIVHADTAAALARVAAEDWLVAAGYEVRLRWCGGPSVRLRHPQQADIQHFAGESHHAALVAACLAVHANSSPNSAPSPQPPHPPA